MFREKESKQINWFWFVGDTTLLHEYYKMEASRQDVSTKGTFYSNPTKNIDRIVHTGLPGSVSETITDLVNCEGVIIKTGKEQLDKQIEDFYRKYEVIDKFESCVMNLTWSAECFMKFVVRNGEIDISVVNPLEARIIYSQGYVYGYEFLIYMSKDGDERIIEKYAPGQVDVCHQRKVPGEIDEDDKWETYRITRTVFNSDEIFAAHSKIPKDAYSKSLQIFDALDETYSRMPDEARKGRMNKFMDESLFPRDKHGQIEKKFKTLSSEWIGLKPDRTEENEPLIKFVMADIDPEKRYLKAKTQYTKDVVRNAGLSYHTYAGGEVKSQISAEAQRELEKLSIRTRMRYIQRFRPFMKKILELFLFIKNSEIKSATTYISRDEKGEWTGDLAEMEQFTIIKNNFNVDIEFEDYIQNSLESRIKIWGSQEAQETFPVEYRIAKVLEGRKVDEKLVKKLAKEFRMEKGLEGELEPQPSEAE